jgi:uncharacterized protein YihD (DUF1040 family)
LELNYNFNEKEFDLICADLSSDEKEIFKSHLDQINFKFYFESSVINSYDLSEEVAVTIYRVMKKLRASFYFKFIDGFTKNYEEKFKLTKILFEISKEKE